jgi:solute carrier family 6 amino acid transporter-like protein 5/7/9/14
MTASYRDIKFMMNITPGIYWKFCWGFFIPLALIAILIYFFVTYKPITYQVHKLEREKQNLAHFFNCDVTLITVILIFKFRAFSLQGHVYPDSAIAAGWLLTAFAMVQVPIFGTIALCKSRKRLADAFRYIQDKKILYNFYP